MRHEIERPNSDITSKIIVSFLLIILIMGVSITWILQKTLQKILIKFEIEQTVVSEVSSAYILTSVGVSIAVIILAGFMAYFISKSITDPIKELTKAASKIKEGNLDYEPKIKSDDEIDELARTFNDMRLGLKDRDDLLNTLLNALKGKTGSIAAILMRKNIQGLIDKNRRILHILPDPLISSFRRGKEGIE